MLQQSSEPGSEQLQQISQRISQIGHVPRASARAEAQVEAFLDQLYGSQADTVTDHDAQQARAAKRQEIHATIDAHMELESTEEHAAELTLLGLRRELEQRQAVVRQVRSEESTAFAIKRSRRLALTSFGTASTFILPSLLLSDKFGDGEWLLLFLNILLPVVAGLRVGTRATTQPVRSSLRAMGILAIPSFLQFLIWAQTQSFDYKLYSALFLTMIYLIPATVTGTAAAAAGKRLRKATRLLEARSAGSGRGKGK